VNCRRLRRKGLGETKLDETFLSDSFALAPKGDILDRNMFGKGAKPVVQDAREAILLRAPAGQDSVAELYASKQTTHRSHFAFQVKLLRYAAAVLSKQWHGEERET